MDERIIRTKIEQIHRRAIQQSWPIGLWQARTADYLAPGLYHYDTDWSAIMGETIWPAAKTLFIRAQVVVPTITRRIPSHSGQLLYLYFDEEGLEGLLSVNDRPYAGIDANHPRVLVTDALAATAEPVDLEAEFMCVGQALSRPERLKDTARLREVAFIQVDTDIEALYYDLWFTWDASKQARDERRRLRLHAALEDALLAIDLTAPDESFRQDAARALTLLREQVNAIAPDPEGGRIFLTGHSHIDTAWLWPLRETVRKCGRTFATVCRLLERYPDFHFTCSQPQLYAYTRQHFPAVYKEIKHWVQAGRWECTSGMWVESDCNIPSGEALIRQFLLGMQLFREEFGVRPKTCWLPDVFGYPASMPQILKGCGLENFYTNKLHWQARNPFPAHLFWWEGVDGTRMLAHIPRLKSMYNGWPNPEELNIAWDNFNQKALYPETLFPFGYGDGGGGPTEAMLEFAFRAAHFPGVATSRQGLEERYFDDVHAANPELPVWSGELYLETHRGTYTTQSAIKRANRKNELLLRETEVFGSLANLHGTPIDVSPLRPLWETLLLLQFHDILPGSSIGEVYHEALADHARIDAKARDVRDRALKALSSGIKRAPGAPDGTTLVAFNSLSWSRNDVVTANIPDTQAAIELVQANGRCVPAQAVDHQNGQSAIVFVPEDVPALGYTTLHVRPRLSPASTTTLSGNALRVTERQVENSFFLIELDEDGAITRLYDKRYEREVVPHGSRANRLQLFQDGPEPEAAWNVHATFDRREYEWEPGSQVTVVEQGPVRAVVRITRRYRDSRIEQDMIVYDQMPRIDFVTRADWQARQVMLKVAFPVEVLSSRATFEIQFGAVERPTHRNTSWEKEKFEVCAHRWADLSEADGGVSLLNDSKYGYDVLGHVLRLTLLRGAQWPDPDADRGQHEFTYAILPHTGDWRTAETVRRAYELNVPITCIALPASETAQGGELPAEQSFFAVEGPAILETLKPAEDSRGWILRLYEPHGGRGRVRVQVPAVVHTASECNMIEEVDSRVARDGADNVTFLNGVLEFTIHPFEVRTFKLG